MFCVTHIDINHKLSYNLVMENFETQIADKIKTLQQTVIEKTSTLDDDIRAKVYSKFQSIKYFSQPKVFR